MLINTRLCCKRLLTCLWQQIPSLKCAGVVKPEFVFAKNPFQHAADFRMLKTTPEFEFLKSKEKPIDCIRVDGAIDERPSVKELQFLLTEVHLTEEKVFTSLTSRYSGVDTFYTFWFQPF